MNTLNKVIKTVCVECENPTECWQDDTKPLCEYCSHANECTPPKKITFYQTRFTGEPRAECKKCNYVSAYWECACDLKHECKGYKL